MAFTEELSAFFDTTDGFAVAATVGAATVNGIFDKAYFESINVQGDQPMFLCASADVASVVHGTAVTISAVNYKVVGVEPDGTGMTLLRLEKQ